MSKRSPMIVVRRRRPRAPRLAGSLSGTLNSHSRDVSPSNEQNPRTRQVLHLPAVPSHDVTARLSWMNVQGQASNEA